MELTSGYKQTDIGIIPQDWEVKAVDEIARVKGGKRLPLGKSLVSRTTPHPYIRVTDMRYGGVAIDDIKYVPDDVFPTIKNYRISSKDIFVSVAGTLGIVGRVPPELDGANLTENADKITDISCDCDFLLHNLMSHRIQSIIESVKTVGAQPKLALGQIEKFTVAFPPTIGEQRVIAKALSDCDALIGILDEVIRKKRDLKQAAMQQLLTGNTRLSGFGRSNKFKRTEYGQIPEDWDLKPLKSISSMNGRIGWQGLKQNEFTGNPDDPFLITGMNFKDGIIRWEEVYHIPIERYEEAKAIQLKVGDVLMTKDGTIGKLLYVESIPYPGIASLNSHLLVFRPLDNQYVPKFLFYQLHSKAFSRYIELNKSGSTFFGLTQGATGNYRAFLPSIPEQTAIAAALSDMDAEVVALEARRDKTRSLKQGMMQELLAGKTRLI